MPYKDRDKQRQAQADWHKRTYVPRQRKPAMPKAERYRRNHESRRIVMQGPRRQELLDRRNKAYADKRAAMREHGTYAKYVKDKCRCELCTEANRVYQQAWWVKHYGMTPEEHAARKAKTGAKYAKTRKPPKLDYEYDGEHNVCKACGAKLIAEITSNQWLAHIRLRHAA